VYGTTFSSLRIEYGKAASVSPMLTETTRSLGRTSSRFDEKQIR